MQSVKGKSPAEGLADKLDFPVIFLLAPRLELAALEDLHLAPPPADRALVRQVVLAVVRQLLGLNTLSRRQLHRRLADLPRRQVGTRFEHHVIVKRTMAAVDLDDESHRHAYDSNRYVRLGDIPDVRKDEMMARKTLLLALAAGMLGGCGMGRPLRPMILEMTSEQGTWRVEASAAILQRQGWEIDILETKVATSPAVPLLERLAFRIVNTSAEPLTVGPNDAMLIGLNGGVFLGLDKPVTLHKGQSVPYVFDPGLRAPVLAYPFRLEAIVHRGQQPEKVKIIFY